MAMLNRPRVYTLGPFAMGGVALWACVLVSGLHPTLAGIILALFIPTQPPLILTARTAARCCGMGRPRRRCARSMRSTSGFDPSADRLLRNAGARLNYLALRCSPWRTLASP